MPSKSEIGFDSLMPCSRVRLVAEDGDVNLFAMDPGRGIFIVEYPDGKCRFCLVIGSVKGEKIRRRVISSDCKLLVVIDGEEIFSSQIIVIKQSNSNFGMTQNVFRRASKDADI